MTKNEKTKQKNKQFFIMILSKQVLHQGGAIWGRQLHGEKKED